jgi:hypothetical protein
VDDAALVGGRERLGHRDAQLPDALDRQAASCNVLVEALPLDQLHRQEAGRGVVLDRVQGDDVRVVERRYGARLALEALEPLRVRGEALRQHLERDVAAEPGVARAVDLAHPARAQRGDDLVAAEPRPCLESQAARA